MVDEHDDDAIESVDDITDGIEPEPEPEAGPGSESETTDDEGAEPMAKKATKKRAAKKPVAAKKEKKAKPAKSAKAAKESKRGAANGKLKGVETSGKSYLTLVFEEGSIQLRTRPSVRDVAAKAIENLI